VLWIYVPDYANGGKMRNIQNVTIARSPYKSYWKALDVIKNISPSRYPAHLTEAEKTALTKWIGFD
jgi:hypothetical protein